MEEPLAGVLPLTNEVEAVGSPADSDLSPALSLQFNLASGMVEERGVSRTGIPD